MSGKLTHTTTKFTLFSLSFKAPILVLIQCFPNYIQSKYHELAIKSFFDSKSITNKNQIKLRVKQILNEERVYFFKKKKD